MNRCRGALLALVSLGGLLVASLAPAAYAADPTVTVTPSSNLEVGDRIVARATGLAPRTRYQVIVCDSVVNDDDRCDTVKTLKSSAAGVLSANLQVPGVVEHHIEVGEEPVYCRDDKCRVFVTTGVVDESTGEYTTYASDPLEVKGSTVGIDSHPSTDLRNRQHVKVTGLVGDATGRTVVVQQQVCFSHLTDFGCESDQPAHTVVVGSDGSFRTDVYVRRFVSGFDCADTGTFAPSCYMTAVVLDRNGNVDQSFGQGLDFLQFRQDG